MMGAGSPAIYGTVPYGDEAVATCSDVVFDAWALSLRLSELYDVLTVTCGNNTTWL